MSISEYAPLVKDAVAEVLESMCFLSLDEEASTDQPVASSFIARKLDFDGPFSGSFGVYASPESASLIACNLLGYEPDEVGEEQVADSMGELANMFCGAVLCRIELKRAFALSKPVPDKQPCSSLSARARLCSNFHIDGRTLHTWMETDEIA